MWNNILKNGLSDSLKKIKDETFKNIDGLNKIVTLYAKKEN